MLQNYSKKILVPNNVFVKINEGYLYFNGKMGKIFHKVPNILTININDNIIIINLKKSISKKFKIGIFKSILNTTHILLKNYIYGVTYCFKKNLLVKGVGYKAIYNNKNKNLELILGYSHNIIFKIPNDINISIYNNDEIEISGVSKYQVGQVTANIRALRIPDIYKGIGIRYKNENIKFKISKKSK